jgi:hypothetical protein
MENNVKILELKNEKINATLKQQEELSGGGTLDAASVD